MNENIKKIAKSGDYEIKELEDKYVLLRENLMVTVGKTFSEKSDETLLKKVVNEAYGFADAGYYGNMGNGYPYIEYKILPLNKSLEQKVNKNGIKANKNKNNRMIHVGDFVSGCSKMTKKKYDGIIMRIVRDDANDVVTVYVLSRGHGRFIPLDPSTIKLDTPYPVKRRTMKFINSGNVIANGVEGFTIGGVSR